MSRVRPDGGWIDVCCGCALACLRSKTSTGVGGSGRAVAPSTAGWATAYTHKACGLARAFRTYLWLAKQLATHQSFPGVRHGGLESRLDKGTDSSSRVGAVPQLARCSTSWATRDKGRDHQSSELRLGLRTRPRLWLRINQEGRCGGREWVDISGGPRS